MRPLFGIFVIALAAACGGLDDEGSEPSTTNNEPSAPFANPAKAPKKETPAPADPAPAISETSPRPSCELRFEADVLPALVTTCANSCCHQNVVAPFIATAAARESYDAVMAKGFGSLEWIDPHPSYSGADDTDFRKIIDAWRMCGAPF